ncbi:hypothetical protein GALL_282100 [mine drainage metagenome]|uniref:Cation-transporting P-type ATPase N-terminal domain-containing protein n=1 Tax=mine drainage metagenome TaxID=410659 RepID=A0A1J5R1R8_9ZZZZ
MQWNGLSGAEAQARLKRDGPDQIRPKPQRRLVLQFLARFQTVYPACPSPSRALHDVQIGVLERDALQADRRRADAAQGLRGFLQR